VPGDHLRSHAPVARAVEGPHSHLPWRDIADAGNVYRHEYDNVAADFVFKTSKADLPLLLAAVEQELRRSPLEPDHIGG